MEAEGLESEINNVIEKAEGVIKQLMKKSQTAPNEQTVPQSVPHMTDQSPHSPVNKIRRAHSTYEIPAAAETSESSDI